MLSITRNYDYLSVFQTGREKRQVQILKYKDCLMMEGEDPSQYVQNCMTGLWSLKCNFEYAVTCRTFPTIPEYRCSKRPTNPKCCYFVCS